MTRVKMCGMTRPEDATHAASLGVWAIGLVFWSGSPRSVTEARARRIIAALPPGTAVVGVFVNEPVARVADLAARLGLAAVQLHGDEPVADLQALSCGVIKAVTLHSHGTNPWWRVSPDRATLLLDTADPIRHGGTGRSIDWTGAASIARTRSVVLSGGLRAENVAEAIRTVRPDAVDVSSGIESSPGVKDVERMAAFMQAVGRADEEAGRKAGLDGAERHHE